jgi:TRAP transporter TAXI family solute receptor
VIRGGVPPPIAGRTTGVRTVSRNLLALSLLAAGLQGAIVGQAADIPKQRDLVNAATVGIISGGITGTYVRIASDLADAFDQGYDLRVVPVIGKGSVRNIEDLLLLRGIDIAIVQSDVLDFYKRTKLYPGIEDKIAYITKLYNEEVHLLARAEFNSVDDLRGRRVNFGTEGSGTFMTAGIIFDELGVEVEATTYPEPEALAKLRAGEIAALVFVGGQPLTLVTQIEADSGLRLLPIAPERVHGAYLPATLTAASYPNLIAPGESVPTLAVGAVMAAYDWPADSPRSARVKRFVDHFFADFDRLKQAPYHKKWQEVDLRAPVPGWRRLDAARADLDEFKQR